MSEFDMADAEAAKAQIDAEIAETQRAMDQMNVSSTSVPVTRTTLLEQAQAQNDAAVAQTVAHAPQVRADQMYSQALQSSEDSLKTFGNADPDSFTSLMPTAPQNLKTIFDSEILKGVDMINTIPLISVNIYDPDVIGEMNTALHHEFNNPVQQSKQTAKTAKSAADEAKALWDQYMQTAMEAVAEHNATIPESQAVNCNYAIKYYIEAAGPLRLNNIPLAENVLNTFKEIQRYQRVFRKKMIHALCYHARHQAEIQIREAKKQQKQDAKTRALLT